MPIILGFIFLALGISLAVVWWTSAFVAALQVLLVLFLILAGLILTLVGYSEMKAAREFHDATTLPPKEAQPQSTPE